MASDHETDPVAVAWREVEAQWDDDEAHRKFIALCAATGSLAEAGRRYREVRDTDPERSAEAKRRIDAVLGNALQNMQLARTARPTRKHRLTWVGFGLCAFFIVYALLAVLRARPH